MDFGAIRSRAIGDPMLKLSGDSCNRFHRDAYP